MALQVLDRLHAWVVGSPLLRVFTAVTRVLLAMAFLPSGLTKALGRRFTTLPVTDPVGYFFDGFFSAPGYYRFVGVLQLVAAALLMIPRTAALGAVVYLPIILNIFVITVSVNFGGTILITGSWRLPFRRLCYSNCYNASDSSRYLGARFRFQDIAPQEPFGSALAIRRQAPWADATMICKAFQCDACSCCYS
jgi:uncharacterized membrane protein YphA (DoxX/SURF4 family)